MPFRARLFSTLWLATLASAGCSLQDVGPTSEELQPSFAELTPEYWSIAKIEIVASESVGSEAEPRFESRFRAVLTLEEDTFKKVGELDEYSLLLPVATRGDRRTASGVATSVPRDGAWQVELEFESDPFGSMGESRSSFPSPTVIKGSDNESALRLLRADRIEDKDPEPPAPLSAERRHIESIVSTIKIFDGIQTDRNDRQARFVIQFSSFESVSGHVAGKIRWYEGDTKFLKPSNTFVGIVVDDQLELAESVQVDENRLITMQYQLEADLESGGLLGKWQTHWTSGHVTIDVP